MTQKSRKFAFDVGITFLASIANVLVSFIITILLGKFVGANDLGLYRFIATFFSLILLISLFGIPSAVIKYVAENKKNIVQLNKLASSGLITSIFIGFGFSIILLLASKEIERIFGLKDLSDLIWFLVPVFPFALVNETFLAFLNGLREMKKFAITFVLKSFLTLIITTILIVNDFGAKGAVLGITLSTVGSSLFLIIITKKYYDFTLIDYFSTSRKLLSFGIKIVIAQIINETTNQLDIILVGFFLIANEIGYYAVAISLSRFLWIIPLSIQKITYPTTAEYWANSNHQKLYKILDRSMKYSTICLVLLGLTIVFGTKEIVFFVFDEGFVHSINPLIILLFGTVIRGSIAQPIGGSLTGIGRPDLVLKSTLIITALNLLLGILLVPRFGIIGAAFSTSISLIIGSFINLFLVIKYLRFDFDFIWFIQMGAIALIMISLQVVTLILFNQPLISGSLIIGITILMIYTFQLTPSDKKLFMSLMNSLLPLKK